MSLALATIGEENTIKRIVGNTNQRRYLETLGFTPGGTAIVINIIAGNVIVNVKESRIAISQEMAQKIII